MAIKLPDPGNGIPEQKTGNDEWTNMKIVRDNFADQSNAASRLIGTNSGNVPEYRDAPGSTITAKSIAGTGWGGNAGQVTISEEDFPTFLHTNGSGVYRNTVSTKYSLSYAPLLFFRAADTYFLMSTPRGASPTFYTGGMSLSSGSVHTETKGVFYTNLNTTKDSNGFIKASSPVLRVFSDHIEGNGDGEAMGAKFVKKGVGNYLIKGTTGLAEEGWKIELPQDENKNPLVAVEINGLDNGDVSLKTYKRKFDFETVSIVADHDNPIDIPETRWVDLRFNDLPQEQLDESAI